MSASTIALGNEGKSAGLTAKSTPDQPHYASELLRAHESLSSIERALGTGTAIRPRKPNKNGDLRGGAPKAMCLRGHVNPPRNGGGACIPCQRLKDDARYRADPKKRMENNADRKKRDPDGFRDYGRAQRLGVPVAEVRRLIEASGMKCEACRASVTNETLRLDHDHKTGLLRGVLCHFCNVLEGMLNKKAERVAQVQTYVARKAAP